ncbi:hypothetical protein BBP40_011064 [Aspergillus hancockii]|nr:hypothetical protein BBP40_011064 [Aspergillus hancockii]
MPKKFQSWGHCRHLFKHYYQASLENHEMLVNQKNTVLSFQAHPEVQTALAKKMLLEEDDVYNGNLSQLELEDQLTKLDQPTDGFEVLRWVIEWVKE